MSESTQAAADAPASRCAPRIVFGVELSWKIRWRTVEVASAGIVLAAPLLVALFLCLTRYAEADAERAWGEIVMPVREFRERFARRDTNSSARELERLAARLGIDAALLRDRPHARPYFDDCVAFATIREELEQAQPPTPGGGSVRVQGRHQA